MSESRRRPVGWGGIPIRYDTIELEQTKEEGEVKNLTQRGSDRKRKQQPVSSDRREISNIGARWAERCEEKQTRGAEVSGQGQMNEYKVGYRYREYRNRGSKMGRQAGGPESACVGYT